MSSAPYRQQVHHLVQVTDMHLYADAEGALVGMNCAEGLRDVLALIREHEPHIDAVLCTGDVSQDNSRESYCRCHEAVATLGAPQYWIAGNHDELPTMRAALGDERQACFSSGFSVPGWRVVMLNSNVLGQAHGFLDEAELTRLDAELSASSASHALVCLHHNCVPVAAAWLQQHALQNSEALFAVLDRHPQVKAVLFGHIHQELVHERRQVLYLGSPSTCVQFHPTNDKFALDDLNPGYRWLELFPDGELRTGVRRVQDKRYPIDFSGIGY